MTRKCSCGECCCEDSQKQIRVYFCPKCESKEVGYVFGFGNAFGIIPKMECKKCGFSSMTFPILVLNAEKLKRANAKIKSKRRKR
jgi:ArsR family metal-binding transcriptional regulator